MAFKKNFTDATRAIASLSQRCGGYRTIHVGHLRGHICIDQKEIIARRINDAVGIVNRARAIAERATEMLIDCICSSNQDTHLLLQLTHGGEGGATYWQNLLRMIIDGNIDARVGPEHLPILEKIEALWGDEFLKNLSWPDSNIKIPMLTVLIKKVAADIDAVFRIHKDAWVIALDPGATCITGAVAFDPNHRNHRRNLAVTTKCLAEPERRYRNWLEANKPEVISAAERECTKSDQETWAVFLERFVRSYDIAREYYSTNKYKRKRWDADKAKRGELDRVSEGIVNMVDESMGHKLSGDKQVIVAIGMGDFSSTKSRHVMFIRGYLQHDERPTYLKPPSKDKNNPMKRKADEGGISRGGPSKSRKTR
ncbi:hypothetical protein SeLEV6574_g01757 [Synchytrium endobioticum]|uniref:Uncharacterized protein n=1 Tax=Synchytrium endobioticum TaxID=286115 RepID=A0A507DDH1_9FUNG|nr:hypothetical protein SeLEV6574_g01757 [Synchytrium endobioticum]